MSRRMKSIKDELVKKSREAMLAAVQIYNNPQITFKTESFIALSVIAWTYLLHAYYRTIKVNYRYFRMNGKRKKYDRTKYGAYKHWELERCINCKDSPLDVDTTANLQFLIGIRHEIEHQMTDKIDEYLSAKLQACAINYDYYITTLFGERYNINKNLAFSIQFSPISPEQDAVLKNNPRLISNVQNFISEFEENLSDETIKNSRYACKLYFIPISVNREGQADKRIKFVKSDSPEAAENINKTIVIKETEKKKFLPGQIVQLMKNKGYAGFNMTHHTRLWKQKDAKNSKHHYGVSVAGQWYWYENWLMVVEDYCKKQKF